MRVQIPAYTDRWMMGDRYGEVMRVKFATVKQRAALEKQGRHRYAGTLEIASVKLDISGKTVKVVFSDCSVVD